MYSYNKKTKLIFEDCIMKIGEIINESMFGTQRVIEKFLWLPVEIDYQIRWLERVKIKQNCIVDDNEFSESGYRWKNIEWVDDEF